MILSYLSSLILSCWFRRNYSTMRVSPGNRESLPSDAAARVPTTRLCICMCVCARGQDARTKRTNRAV